MNEHWPSVERCSPAGTSNRFQNSNVEMPMTAPGVRIGATITPYRNERERPCRPLIRMAAAVPMGTEIATTASAISTVLRAAWSMRSSFHRSTNQREVKPTQGKTEGKRESLSAAPPMTISGASM